MNTIIAITSVKKSYVRNRPIFENLNTQILTNETVGITGANGCGKSTFLKLLSTLLKQDQGSIIIQNLCTLKNPNEIKKIIGIVFDQKGFFPKLTGLQNLIFYASLYGIKEPLSHKAYQIFYDHMDATSFLNKTFETYSSGMKVKLFMMKALLHDPEIILLDEPLNHLDDKSQVAFVEFIEKLHRQYNKTILLTYHGQSSLSTVLTREIRIENGTTLTP